jgi:hypothetical protein
MDQQQRIEELIDELYAVQKQAGDRMVELTNENKWILDKQERNVSKSIDDVRKYSKILVGTTLAVCIVGGVVLGWLIYRWTEGVKRDVYWTYREVGKVIYKQEQLKNMLEGIVKKSSAMNNIKKSKGDGDINNIQKSNNK